MSTQTVFENGKNIAVISGDDAQIVDGKSALDVIMSASYALDTNLIAIEKKAIAEEFFDLSTGIAGEVLQKLVNYHIKAAVFGDFSVYSSDSLKALIHESNRGNNFFFLETKSDAIAKLVSLT